MIKFIIRIEIDTTVNHVITLEQQIPEREIK